MLQEPLTEDISACLLRGLAKWPLMRIGTLGAFVRKEQPARWDPQEQVIHPPGIVLDFVKGFESQLSFEDYLVDSEGLSRSEAKSVAHKLQTDIVDGLSHSSSFVIPGLGKLTRTVNGEFSFYTEEAALQLLDEYSFGLKRVGARREHPIQGSGSEKELLMKALPKESASRKERMFGWKFFLVLALLGSLGVLLVQYGPWDIQIFSTQNNTALSTSEPESVPIARASDTVSNQSQPHFQADPTQGQSDEHIHDELPATDDENAASESIPSSSPSDINEPQEAGENTLRRGNPIASAGSTRGLDAATNESDVPPSPVGDMGVFRGADGAESSRILNPIRFYHLIAGSFVDASRAQEFVNGLREEGFDAMILFPEEGTGEPHRVSIYRDHDRQKVSAYADKLKQMGRQGGWVYAERSESPE